MEKGKIVPLDLYRDKQKNKSLSNFLSSGNLEYLGHSYKSGEVCDQYKLQDDDGITFIFNVRTKDKDSEI